MAETRLNLTREQILAFRRRVGVLDERLPWGNESLRRAAWAGLQDSMPRAALLSIHARVEGAEPNAWEDPSLVQLWGPRFSTYVVAERDLAVFSLGRLPEEGKARHLAEDLAERIHALLDGERVPYGEVGAALGTNPNRLKYAAPTSRVVIRWEGARAPLIWTLPRSEVGPLDARLELARRYLRVYGPATSASFTKWAGIGKDQGRSAFEILQPELTPVRTPIGEGWILSEDEMEFRTDSGSVAPARLLPSGDSYYLYWGADRELLVTESAHRDELWTSRVWPGALLVHGEIVGIWRRQKEKVTVQAWHRLSKADRLAVEEEAATLPLPGVEHEITVRWDDS